MSPQQIPSPTTRYLIGKKRRLQIQPLCLRKNEEKHNSHMASQK